MAGQIPLDTKYYPSDFNYESFNVSGSATGTYDLIYADRPMVIDSIRVTYPNVSTTSGDQNMKFRKYNPVKGVAAPSFATVSSGDMVVEDVTEVVVVKTSGGAGTGTAADFPDALNFPVLTAHNVLKEGEILRYTGVALTGVAQITIQVRWRSQF